MKQWICKHCWIYSWYRNNILNLNLSYFASSAKAIVAETRGVEALVPLNPSVQQPLRSIVTRKNIYIYINSEKYSFSAYNQKSFRVISFHSSYFS